MKTHEELTYKSAQALLSVNRLAAENTLTEASIALSSIQLAKSIVAPALERIGAEWELGRVALAQVYMSGRICERLAHTILPIDSPNRRSQPRMAIAVLQDYHLLDYGQA